MGQRRIAIQARVATVLFVIAALLGWPGGAASTVRAAGYLQPGAATGGAANQVLLHVGDYPVAGYMQNWSAAALKPYVTYVSAGGVSQDWLFDSALFLAIYAQGPAHRALIPVCATAPATLTDWNWYLDRLFASTDQIAGLEAAVAAATPTLGARNMKVAIAIPFPDPRQTSFGVVGGVNRNFQNAADRQAAANWFVDQAIARWNSGSYPHLTLSTFYWSHENNTAGCVPGNDDAVIQNVAAHVQGQGRTFEWIPYYNAPGGTNWSALGFSAAYQQPNYFFDRFILEGAQRLGFAADVAQANGMGYELEFDDRLFSSFSSSNFLVTGAYGRFLDYLDAGVTYGYMTGAAKAYYQSINTIAKLANSSDARMRTLYDNLYAFTKGTYQPSAPTLQIAAPYHRERVSGTIPFAATASDPTGVTKVEFYVDGTLVSTDTTAPYQYGSTGLLDTTTLPDGPHGLQAIAYNPAGRINVREASIDVANPLLNGSFENSTPPWGFTYTQPVGGWSGTLDATQQYAGSNSYKIALASSTATQAGQYASLYQDVPVVPWGGTYTLRFAERDDRGTSSPAGYHRKAIYVNGQQAWSQDIAADGTGWAVRTLDVTDLVRDKASVRIEFRLQESAGVTSYAASVWYDAITLEPQLGTGGHEIVSWSAASANRNVNWGVNTAETDVVHSGRFSASMTYPTGVASAANDTMGLSQIVAAPAGAGTLTFKVRDSVNVGAPTGYRFVQALIGSTVVWEQDIALAPTSPCTDGTDFQCISVGVTLTAATTLTLRAFDKVGVGSYDTKVWWDDIAIQASGQAGTLPLLNGGFESSMAAPVATSSHAHWTYYFNASGVTEGQRRLHVGLAGGTPTTAGEAFTLSYRLAAVPGWGTCYLHFKHADSRPTTAPAGYHFKRALVNGVVKWSRDVTADGTGEQTASVNLGSCSALTAPILVQLQVYEQAGVNDYALGVDWDGVEINAVP